MSAGCQQLFNRQLNGGFFEKGSFTGGSLVLRGEEEQAVQ